MKHHLIIGGTGRAGTTFLVQYLNGCGLETHISKYGSAWYDEDANAGLEDMPMELGVDHPYVVKSPWFYEFAERLLARDDIVVDAVILPMRGIVEAATSRTVNELRTRCANEKVPDDCTLWESWAASPGGVVYSLNPLDQARLLAMGFHEVVHALVKRDIPIVLLDFPRFVEDAEYLCAKLLPVLGDKVSRQRALDVHRQLADPGKVRVGRDLAVDAGGAGPRAPVSGPNFPDYAAQDRIALRRELARARAHSADLEWQLAQLKNSMANAAPGDWKAALRHAATLLLEGFRRPNSPGLGR
ncbi:hypothetical protein [Variovorax sp. dw_954]|uniref:hypothetical protein n=1 Tax=Variovorax sp. dw_954 TaxID=2720078 RepID=UPI001BD2F6BF|nr:hypothetical protein [Variovorax sp. dw_954]